MASMTTIRANLPFEVHPGTGWIDPYPYPTPAPLSHTSTLTPTHTPDSIYTPYPRPYFNSYPYPLPLHLSYPTSTPTSTNWILSCIGNAWTWYQIRKLSKIFGTRPPPRRQTPLYLVNLPILLPILLPLGPAPPVPYTYIKCNSYFLLYLYPIPQA